MALGSQSAAAQTVRFGSPTLLEAGSIEGAAINAHGEAVAVWRRDRVVRVASRRADSRWARPVTLDRGFRCRKDFRIAVNARGDAAVAWTQNRGCYEGPTPTLFVSTRTERRGWSKPQAIGRTWGPVSLGITARGGVVLGWRKGRSIWTISGRGTRWPAPSRLGQTLPAATPLALDVRQRTSCGDVGRDRMGRGDSDGHFSGDGFHPRAGRRLGTGRTSPRGRRT